MSANVPFDIYDKFGTIKPVAELIGKVDFEPVMPMTLMEAAYTIISFLFILSIAFTGLSIIPKNRELMQNMLNARLAGNKKPKSKE
ncbi:hypothetical protein AYI70_g3472 [Smittium culicis]|uniref:Uncharacterized protein n=1 Tax=Smittium culicis TaxID=133412 RepID=A0A1R1Y3Z1_9FUNG|nr:hypothetical protein AYI70_g3472 [Smittium culicis]